jgi:ribulose bisphosphate carboxylase small subunit
MGFISDLMNRGRDEIQKDRITLLYSEVKQAYKDKIEFYTKRIDARNLEMKQLLDFHTEACDIKKLESFSVTSFMRRVEVIGIDNMNDETIIEMLRTQYKQWFD